MMSPRARRHVVGWSFLVPGAAATVALFFTQGAAPPAAFILVGWVFPGSMLPFMSLVEQSGEPSLAPMYWFLWAYAFPACMAGVVLGSRLLSGRPVGPIMRWAVPLLWLGLAPLGTVVALHALWRMNKADFTASSPNPSAVRWFSEGAAAVVGFFISLAWAPIGLLFAGTRTSLTENPGAAAVGAVIAALVGGLLLTVTATWRSEPAAESVET